MWKTRTPVLAAALTLVTGAAFAEPCRTGSFEDVPFTVCEADPSQDDLRLWHSDAEGQIFGTFDRLVAALADAGQHLSFAMNGGMYHDDRAPVGLYVEAGKQQAPLITAEGPGNFGLLPNGVFCLGPEGASVTESRAFAESGRTCSFASQSGPLLVAGGALHPRFLPDSDSVFVRNGVGVRPDGTAVFVISDRPVNFHRFARLFRDGLGAPDALYIDGKVSRLYAPGLGRHDRGFPLGPIVGVAVPLN